LAARLRELEPAFRAANLDVPFGWQEAISTGIGALQAGQLDRAVRCLRWCDAIDPKNEGTRKNLGLAYAYLGRAAESVRAFSSANRADGPKWAAQSLSQANRWAEAHPVYRYVTLLDAGAEWQLGLAFAAYAAKDFAAAVDAFRKVDAQTGGAMLDAARLNGYAAALVELGAHADAETIARRQLAAATGNKLLTALAKRHLALALLGLDRAYEAVVLAEEAAAENELPQNAPLFAESVERARANRPVPTWSPPPERRAWQALTDGDFAAVLALGGAGAPAWCRLAALHAAEVRSDAEAAVPEAARALAEQLLDEQAGATDAWGARIIAESSRVRDEALIGDDLPAPGVAPSREAFHERWRALRGG
jgi:tetratricopeptide (TPR) repeat protein